ncbi:MAG: DUF3500 domain-containing protein, partial [Caldilineaceae bacterium]|nr:DUF3500 domain-containing protein [Caldilineaceae bacterium]
MHNLNRRNFLRLSALGAGVALLGTSGCGGLSGGAGSDTLQRFAELAAQEEAAQAENSDSITYASKMATAANNFAAALNDEQRGQATYSFTDTERYRWHWTNPSNFPRNGMALRDLNEDQKVRALELLQASLSVGGLEKALNIMALQQDLGNDPELYYVTLFGTPGSAEPWGWRWEGHHLSHHFTVVGDRVATTPFFLGAWPTTTEAGMRAMPREEDAGLELVNSLTGSALETAILQERTLGRHVTQNEATVAPLDPVGLLYGDMNDSQQRLVDEIISTYLATQPEHIAQPTLNRVDEAGRDT